MPRTDNRANIGDGPAAADASGDPAGDGGPAVAGALDALAKQALGNDPVDVRRFLIGIAPTIRRVCRGVLGRHHPDLEDAIQDCLIDTMRALPRYRFEGSVVHYVTKISIRRAIAARGRTALRTGRFLALDQRRSLGHAEWQGDDENDDGTTGGIADQRLEQERLVRQIVGDLSRVQAEAIILRLMLGFSIEEIASITDASINTVKTRLRLGKNSLRRRLEHGGHAPFKSKRPPR